jgi:hypothetical protein
MPERMLTYRSLHEVVVLDTLATNDDFAAKRLVALARGNNSDRPVSVGVRNTVNERQHGEQSAYSSCAMRYDFSASLVMSFVRFLFLLKNR